MPDDDDDRQELVGGILGEMIELGTHRKGVVSDGTVRRSPLAGATCPGCGSPVTSKPLLSGRVFRCSGCAKTWSRPPATFLPTTDPRDADTQPSVQEVDVDHLVVDPRPFRVNAVTKE